MLTLISVAHVLISILLIILVLIQDSKGGAMGVLGGGGGGGGTNSVFGSTGAGDFLTKATRWVAIVFAATCIGLAYVTTNKTDSVLDGYIPPAAEQTAPVDTPAAPTNDAEKPADK